MSICGGSESPHRDSKKDDDMLTNIEQLLRPNPAGIPEEMKTVTRWLGFKIVPKTKRDGTTELTKEPRQGARPDRKASSTNPATWCDFETAYNAVLAGQLDGLGFALGDGWAGVDLDDAVAERELKPAAREVASAFQSYAEFSVSGTGVHILVHGDVPAGKRSGNIEVYGQGRYFTVSGQPLPFWPPGTVEPRQAELDELVARIEAERACMRPAGQAATDSPAWPDPPPPPPATVVEIIDLGHRICPHFGDLWRGAIDVYDGDASRADMALIGSLVWLCGPGQQSFVRDIATQSGLRREKWETHRTYLQRTIDAAYRDRGPDDFYNWRRRAPALDITPLSAPGGDSVDGSLDLRRAVTLDDIGFARRLAAAVCDRIKYVEGWRKFIYWDGRRWALDDGACVVRAAQDLRDILWIEYAAIPHEEKTKASLQFIQSCGNAKHLQNIVSLTKSQQPIRISHDALDRHRYLLNVRNGTIDLRTGALLPHEPANLITQLAAVDFDPRAASDDWLLFVNQCMQGDPELVRFLQVSAGLAISSDVSPQLLWCHYGRGANGKSTFLGALANMLGDYAVAAPANFLLMRRNESHPTETATLYGKRLVTAIECEGGQRLRESFVKSITGGDMIATRRCNEDFWMMAPTWQLHVSFNDPPTINGTDDGIRRRLKIIPWRARFEGASQDPTLKARLESEQHRAAILNWCLAGIGDFIANGIPIAGAVAEATDEYVADQDSLGNFLDECCHVGRPGYVVFNNLMMTFHQWLEAHGENPRAWNRKRLSGELHRRGFSKVRPSAGEDRGKTLYTGLTLDITLAPSLSPSDIGQR
jgi:putative DNA primase/helicase